MKTILAAAIALLSAGTACADTMFLNDGSEVSGTVKSLGANGAEISVSTGIVSYSRDKILRVQLVKEFRPGGKRDKVIEKLIAAPPSPQDFPDDSYLFWLTDKSAVVKKDGSMLTADRTVKLVLRERGRDAAGNDRYPFMPGAETVSIDYAYSVSKGTQSCLTDTSVQEGSLDPAYPVYDKRKSLKFSVPNVDPGSVVDTRVTTDIVPLSTYTPQGYFSFRGSEPRKTARLTLEAVSTTAVKYAALNLPESVKFSKRARKGRVQMVWEAENMPSYKNEPFSPPYALYAPAVYFAPADEWDAIRARLTPLIAPLAELTPEMKDLLSSITKDTKTETGKLEALYNWVTENIKFQPVGMSSGGYLPRAAEQIYKTRVGNQLDKPFLLYTMMREAGFRPQFLYLASRANPFQETVPSVRQFNSAAVLAQADGREYVLTPYTAYLRYDQRPPWMDGACGIKMLGADEKDLFRCLGQEPPEKNGTETRYTITLSREGDAEGSVSLLPHGNDQSNFRTMREMNPAEQKKYLERIAHNMSPRARLVSYEMKGIEGLSAEVGMGFTFSAKDFAIRSGKKFMMLKLPGTFYSPQVAALTQRELPMFWQQKSLDRTVVTLNLPKGWRVYHMPAAVKASGAGNTFEGKAETDGKTLTCTLEYAKTETDQPASKWDEFRRFRQDIAAFGEEWVILEKN